MQLTIQSKIPSTTISASDCMRYLGEKAQREGAKNAKATMMPGKMITRRASASLDFLSQALCTFAMIGYIRKEFPDLKIVLGGGLVSTWVKRPGWMNPFGGLVDHLIAGPGEHPLLDLLGVQSAKQNHYTPDYEFLPIHDCLAPGFI